MSDGRQMRRRAVRRVRFLLCVWKCESPGEAGRRLWGRRKWMRGRRVGDESSEGGEGDGEGE